MAITDPQNTLAYHASRVLTSQRDMSGATCHFVAKQLQAYQAGHKASDIGHGNPEMQALWFYGMNHGLSSFRPGATRWSP
jgi:hypothetical protein